jgi:DTW domain-containing protein YfiP
MVEAQNPARCSGCAMLLRLCICAAMPRISARTQLVLLIHHRELRKPTNTGSLAARCLAGSEVHVSGAKDRPVDYARLALAGATNLVLFPGPEAVPLSAALGAELSGPVRLIVPDGNWGQATRMRRKIAGGEGLRLLDVTLPDGPPTQYRLRREARDRPEGLATLEAIARAYELLEGPHVSRPLLEIFRLLVERTLWSRGRLPAADVFGGVPPLAAR